MRSPRIVVGLMSGTSADGVDAIAAEISGRGPRMRARFLLHHRMVFRPSLRRRLMAVMAPANTSTEELARLHAELGDVFADAAIGACHALGPGRRPVLIGLAGQTVCHLPWLADQASPGRSSHAGRYGGGSTAGRDAGRCRGTVTFQLGEATRVAHRTGIPVVAEFRQSDVAAGGQGAPLVPWTDWVLFRHPAMARAVQNIGGVANITWIPAGAAADEVRGFDTGPGNMVIDTLVTRISNGRQMYDRDGRRAARGRVLNEILTEWLRHPFLRRRPPKTTGREEFGRPFVDAWLPRLRAASSRPEDWIATATAFTARSIAYSVRGLMTTSGHAELGRQGRSGKVSEAAILSRRSRAQRAGEGARGSWRGGKQGGSSKGRLAPVELILCGGGAHNPVLVRMIAAELRDLAVARIDDYNIPAQAKEGLSFAMLAAAYVDRTPANLPQITGASQSVLLGRVILPA